MQKTDLIRPSPIAGTWYNANAQQLAEEVNGYIQAAQIPPIKGKIIGLISPHAGLRYSGPTAGHAWRAVKGQSYDLVVILSPLHQYHPAPFLTSAHAFYQTPIGIIPVDQEAVQEVTKTLKAEISLKIEPIACDQEHSLEIQLPFLQQTLLKDFRLLPLMIRTLSPKLLQGLALTLAQVLKNRNILLVASTDLSHFYHVTQANQLDSVMMKAIEQLDPQQVLNCEADGSGQACGAGGVATVLWTALRRGANQVHLLHHSTSGDVTGDYSQVVGYGAAVITETL